MSKVYIHKVGALSFSHKKDQFEKAIEMGCIVLEFGESVPKGGVLVADTRPKGFIGGRGPDDPNAFMIYEGVTINSYKKMHYSADLKRAINKAKKLANQPE